MNFSNSNYPLCFNLLVALCFLTNLFIASWRSIREHSQWSALIHRNRYRKGRGKLPGVRAAGAADAPDRLPIKSMSTPMPPAYP